jgi:nicotinamide riboside transporter PnuC
MGQQKILFHLPSTVYTSKEPFVSLFAEFFGIMQVLFSMHNIRINYIQYLQGSIVVLFSYTKFMIPNK